LKVMWVVVKGNVRLL